MTDYNYRTNKFYQVILLLDALGTLTYGLLYYYSFQAQSLLLLYWLVFLAFVFLLIYLLSYLSYWVKTHMKEVTYGIAVFLIVQLVLVNHLNEHQIETMLILIGTVAVINLIFPADRLALYTNIIIAGTLGLSLILSPDPLISLSQYIFYLTAAGSTYFISYKQTQQNKTIQKQKETIKYLHDIAVDFTKIEEEKKICEKTIKAAKDLLDFELCHVSLLENERFIPRAASAQMLAEELPIDIGIAGKSYSESKTYIINDIQNTHEAAPTQEDFESGICVPIEGLGVFQAVSTEKQNFTEEELELAEILIAHTETALKRINAQKEIRYKTFHDKLTGLYNRRFFEEELERLDTARQFPLSIVIGDINALKLINDRFGHQKGDELIVKAAKIMKESVRKEDILARWGGDEFAILLPQTKKEGAQKVIDRIMEKCLKTKGEELSVSLSIGVATKSNSDQDITEVLKQADRAMYQNKKRGNLSQEN